MTQSIKSFFAFLVFTLLFISCGDEITNQYLEGDGTPPDVDVIFSSYVLKTIHSFHMDTTAYPDYNFLIDLNLKLDKPQNRNQISKMIIISEDGFGWELFSDELETFYSDEIQGYKLTNLVLNSSSQSSTLYKVKLFSNSNGYGADYQFILIRDFIYPYVINHGWYTQDIYQVSFEYNFIPSSTIVGEAVWIDQYKQYLNSTPFTVSDIHDYRYLRIGNVPAEAYYFYISYQQEINGVNFEFKSVPFSIEERYPENIQILNENINYLEVVKYIPEIQKILILDRSYDYLYIIDFSTLSLDSKISFTGEPYSFTYSNFDDKIYIGCENGKLYSLAPGEPTAAFVKNLGTGRIYGMVVVNKFLIASTYSETFRILNLEDNSVTVKNDNYYYDCYNMVYNSTNNVVYGLSYYGYELSRFNFDPATGNFTDYSYKYVGSSNYYDLILYPDDSRIIVPNGNIYYCSGNVQTDLTNFGTLGQSFNSASFSQDGNGIITLYVDYNYSSNITVYSKDNLQEIGQEENFFDTPEYLVSEGDVIKVLSRYNYGIIAEIFSYTDIISGGGKMISKPVKEKCFLQKKIIY